MTFLKNIFIKPAITVLLIFIFIPSLARCQSDWSWAHPRPTGQQISDSYFVSPYIGWICSHNTIWRTVDGGEEWEFLHTWTDPGYIDDLHFVDSNEGWVCYHKQIHHTTDGGSTWETQNNPTDEALKAVHFTSSECGCIVGIGSTILRTNDGGENWFVQDAPPGYTMRDVFFADSATGWIAYSKSTLLFTETAGTLWEVQSTGITPVGSFHHLWFLDDQTGWIAATTGEVAHTIDGGETWVLQKSADGHIHDIDFADANHGAMVHSYGEAITFTMDGGNSWETESLPKDLADDYYTYTLSHVAPDTILVGAQYGFFFQRTADSAWETLSSHLTVGTQRGITWVPPNDIWICGPYSIVMHSADNGLTWETQPIPTGLRAYDICFLDSNTGYACGATGTFGGAVIKTDNGGETWQSIGPVPCPRFSSLDFISPDSGVVVGISGKILQTIDGGNSWIQPESPTECYLNKFRFCPDGNTGYAVGIGGTVLIFDYSTDSWCLENSGTSNDLYCVFPLNNQMAWAGGWNGTLIKKEYGVIGWNKIAETGNDYLDIWFSDEMNGYFAGTQGLQTTVNGGSEITWSTGAMSEYIRHFCFSNMDTGWGCGDNGHILSTGTFTGNEDEQWVSVNSTPGVPLINPNPVLEQGYLSVNLFEQSDLRIEIYDIAGRVVMSIEPGQLTAGLHDIQMDLTGINPGVYLVRVECSGDAICTSFLKLNQ